MSTTSDDLANFPETADDDPDDVRWALETGKAMWSQGNREDGLKWLKRAAESASEEGADMRAVALAKAAADRRSMLEQPPAAAPGAAGPSGAAAGAGTTFRSWQRAAGATAAAFRLRTGEGSSAIASPAVGIQSASAAPAHDVGHPPPPARPSTPAPAARPSTPVAPAQAAGSVPPRPMAAEAAAVNQAAASAPPPPRTPSVAPQPSPSTPSAMPPQVVDLAPDSSPTAVATPVPAEVAAAPAARSAAPSHHHAVRVAVGPGAAEGELRAVVLAAGQPVPAGNSEALLVALDPAVNLVATRS